ncbi:MAG: hypothetical protein RXO32_03105 [Thermoproteus sp.]
MFAWTAARYGELYAYVASANLTREGGRRVDTYQGEGLDAKVE